jgi:predicted AlkP superfamily pyrophosphatase or phosphodiesterase
MRILSLCLLLLLIPPHAARAEPATRPHAQRVVIISIDGLRPDLMAQADVPHLRGLLRQSAYTFWAQTVEDPYVYTLPAHVSMLAGVHPDVHGVTWNNYIEQAYPQAPTLFELAKRAGRTTAMVSGKMKFIALAKPGTLDWQYLPPDEPVDDLDVVAKQADSLLRAHRPDVLFVHLAGVDTAGHASGWGSAEQLAAVQRADRAVAVIDRALNDLKLADSTLLIVTADHGGAGVSHGGDDPRSRTIPWIVRGPGVRAGYDLTRREGLTIRTADTFATACAALGLPVPAGISGRPVTAIHAEGELLETPTSPGPSRSPSPPATSRTSP